MSQFQRESVEAMLRLLPLDAGGHLDEVTPRVPHVFQAFAGLLDDGALAIAEAGAFLRRHFEPGSPGPGDDRSPDPVGVSQGDSQRPEGTT